MTFIGFLNNFHKELETLTTKPQIRNIIKAKQGELLSLREVLIGLRLKIVNLTSQTLLHNITVLTKINIINLLIIELKLPN